MAELWYESAGALAERLRRRDMSATELLDVFLSRIDEHNPSINAVVSIDVDRARSAAAAADRALARGEAGPLGGVPMTLKDGHDAAALRTTVGSEIFDRVPVKDGTVAARLRAAGAVIVGHSNVPPFLADYKSENPIFGRTNNPWSPDRTPGGSSGGAAAALAAGLSPVEVGSDLAGSLRLPPHFCGVYGLKTTENRVPSTGFFRPLPGVPRSVRLLGAIGPMARDVADLDLVLRVIAGPDGRDVEIPPVPLASRGRRELQGLRLAVAAAVPGADVEQSLRDAVERVAAVAADAGAVISSELPDVDWDDLRLFGDLLGAVTGVFDPGVQLDAEHASLGWYLAALDRRDRFVGAWDRFFEGCDALLLPPATTVAFGHDATSYGDQGHQMVFANLAGLPALTVPAGLDDAGLPVGLQIVGARWSEVRLLEIAAALEEAGVLPGFRPPPGY
ncbi:amidase [Plantactinospora sp. GCM10030261]|uniref:amidase n=1 Tax=Plantactinospora sp. GCM10030261 TaxID=3273420 RepID=UPI00360D7235